jgi:cellulose synthase/poly-beta-1,6-N-acetylglucosamine synthase-like glycosyltransferase
LQDYQDYSLWFVVEHESDPAYAALCAMKADMAGRTTAKDVRVLVAGPSARCSQKLHNLLYACSQVPDDVVMLAFADSDITVKSSWLAHLVYPLRKEQKHGLTTGYRCFVPTRPNLATLALVSMNAAVAQMLGPYGFNHAWGGSMAVRRSLFRRLRVEDAWSQSISDDLVLTRLVAGAGLRVTFVPGCLVASHVSMSWRQLFEFGRRQFIITRVTTPSLWMLALFGTVYAFTGLWAGTALAIRAVATGHPQSMLYAAVPAVFFAGSLCRAVLRQRAASLILEEHSREMKIARWVDILAGWLFLPLFLAVVLSSAAGRTITWRGITYRLLGPMQAAVLRRNRT